MKKDLVWRFCGTQGSHVHIVWVTPLRLGVKIPQNTRVPCTYCMGHTFKFKLGVKIPWDTRVLCTYCMSNTFKLGVKIPQDTRVPWPTEWATPLLLNNTIMLRITGANKSLCEVKGGDTNLTVAPFPMLLHSLMVNTPDSHARQRGFKSQWYTFPKTLCQHLEAVFKDT